MGGPSQQSLKTQDSITQQEIATQKQANDIAAQKLKQSDALELPAIQFNQSLSSGDPIAIMQSLAPELTAISQGGARTKESIFESLAPGAARDVALAQAGQNTASQVASLKANTQLSSFDKLANIGAGLGSFSLQELGAGISAGTAASNANKVNIDAAEQSKASTLGFLGQLAGAGAEAYAGRNGSGGCWIAEAIYGVDDVRTCLVRSWLNGTFKATWYGRQVMRFYLRYGERIAGFLDRHLWCKPLVKPLFDVALRKAVADRLGEHACY